MGRQGNFREIRRCKGTQGYKGYLQDVQGIAKCNINQNQSELFIQITVDNLRLMKADGENLDVPW